MTGFLQQLSLRLASQLSASVAACSAWHEARACSVARRALLMPACPSSARRQAARNNLLLASSRGKRAGRTFFGSYQCSMKAAGGAHMHCIANAMDTPITHADAPALVLC